MILTTERLILREMTSADIRGLSRILQDAEVMYAYEHSFSDEEVEQWLGRQLERYQEDGFGLWAVILKSSGEMIGQCGITMQGYKGVQVPEVGYLFEKAHWNKGYAIESAKACRDYAFDMLGIGEVYSIIRENNLASINVARKNGMEKRGVIIKHYHDIDMPHIVFSIKRT